MMHQGAGLIHSLHAGAQGVQLLVYALVAPIHVVDVGDLRLAVGGQAGQDEGRPRPHVQRPHPRPQQGRRAGHDGGGGAGGDHLRPHLAQLGHVEQAVVEHPLVHVADALGLGEEGGHGGLQVGGQTGIGQGLHGDRSQGASAPHPQPVLPLFHLDAGLAQLLDEGAEVLHRQAPHLHLPTGDGGGDGEGAGLDAVGDVAVRRPPQLRHSLDLDEVGARTLDAGAHAHQHLGQGRHLRLAGGVDDDGAARGGDGRQHQVLGAQDAGVVQEDAGAPQLARLGHKLLSLPPDAGAQHLEALQVHVYGPLADDVAAGRRAGRPSEAPQQRPHDQEAATEVGHQFAGGSEAVDAGGVDAQDVGPGPLHPGPQATQHLGHEVHVADVGDVLDVAVVGGEEGGGHGAQGGVLGARDIHGAPQGAPPLDEQAAAGLLLLAGGGRGHTTRPPRGAGDAGGPVRPA